MTAQKGLLLTIDLVLYDAFRGELSYFFLFLNSKRISPCQGNQSEEKQIVLIAGHTAVKRGARAQFPPKFRLTKS